MSSGCSTVTSRANARSSDVLIYTVIRISASEIAGSVVATEAARARRGSYRS